VNRGAFAAKETFEGDRIGLPGICPLSILGEALAMLKVILSLSIFGDRGDFSNFPP
jgi:hypothetical protein